MAWTLYNGVGAPGAIAGQLYGDNYIDCSSGDLYQYTTLWTKIATIPGSVLSYKNYIMNGGFQFAQRGTSFAAIANGAYSLDRWKYLKSGAVVHTITQNTDVQTGAKSQYSIKLDVTTADSSIAAGDYSILTHIIEGNIFRPLVGKTCTLSFWVKGAKTGIHCVAFSNSNSDKTYTAEYTISSANTWEYKTIPITFNYADGTWDYTTGIGLQIYFMLSCGSTYQSTAGTWQTGTYLATVNQVNETDSTDNNFYLAEVMLNEGSVAAPFQPFGGNYINEQIACNRYYWRATASSTAYPTIGMATQGSTIISYMLRTYPVPMRAQPVAAYGGNLKIIAGDSAVNVSSLGTDFGDNTGCYLTINTPSFGAIGRSGLIYLDHAATNWFEFNAEL